MSKPGFPTTARSTIVRGTTAGGTTVGGTTVRRTTARRATGLLTVAAALTLAAACSSGKSSPPTTNPPPPASTTAPATSTTVTTGMATVSGTQTTVLTAPDGHTLYYFTPDTAGGQPTCTGSCASLWPPLVNGTPTAAAGVTGKLTVATGPNGSQVVYNGHPLYEYKPDTAAGQATGEGVMGKWYVATPGLAAGNAPGTPAPSSPSSPGGGYGSGGY